MQVLTFLSLAPALPFFFFLDSISSSLRTQRVPVRRWCERSRTTTTARADSRGELQIRAGKHGRVYSLVDVLVVLVQLLILVARAPTKAKGTTVVVRFLRFAYKKDDKKDM